MILIYFVTLFIAPQLWIEPFVGIRVDLIVYPLWIVILGMQGNLKDFFKLNIQDVFFLALIFWILFSTLLNDSNIFTSTIIFNYFKWFVLYRLVALTLLSDKAISSLANKMIFIIGVIVVEAIQHKYYSFGFGWAGQPLGWVDQAVLDAGGSGRTKWINIFDGPGVFCVMFTLVLPFLLVRLDEGFSKKHKFVAILLMLPLFLAIWTTGSRGGFLATLAILGAYFMSRLNISFIRMIKIGVFLVVIFMLAPSHLTQTKDKNNSAQHRVDMWQLGIEMVENNPLFGIGKGNFAFYSGSLIAHNSFIEIMGEIGAVGAIIWILLLFASFRSIYLYLKIETEPIKKSMAKAVSLSLIGYLVSSFFVTLEYETLYFMLAITRSLTLHNNIDLQFKTRHLFYGVGMFLGMYVILKIFVASYY